MKKSESHIIKSQRYEIVLDKASKAYEYQSKISRLQERHISVILQKVMDTYSTGEYLFQFDEIVLDLGAISVANFERELENRIEEAFMDYFKNNVNDNGTLKVGKRKKIYHKHIEQFEFFLENGYVAWNTSLSHQPIEIFKTLLKENENELIALLKKQGRKENIRKRLIGQLEDSFLEQIVLVVAGSEGVYINQYSRDIVKHQHDHTLVETGTDNFRNAIWEIVLSYIFLEVSNFSGQKIFLQHLLHKIAQKYRLTYKDLLKTIASIVKSHNNKSNTKNSFGKLVVLIQEEEENSKNILFEITDKSQISDFIDILKYYLKYNSLPVGSKLSSFTLFRKSLERILDQKPKEFYDAFAQIIRNESMVNGLITSFPDTVINTIVERSDNQNLNTLTTFLQRINAMAGRLGITSSTLKITNQLSGKICLGIYNSTSKGQGSEIKEFLFKIITYTKIDQGFLKLLKEIASEHDILADQRLAIRVFIKELGIGLKENKEEESVTDGTPVFLRLSEKIYTYHNRKKDFTFKDFSNHLQAEKCTDDILKLTLALLEICSKEKDYTAADVADWMERRIKEIDNKGRQVQQIVTRILYIIKLLEVHKIIYERVEIGLKEYHKTKNKLVTSQDKVNTIPQIIPIHSYNELIKSIYKKFHIRSEKNIYESIQQLITQFSIENNCTETALLQQLQKEISKKKNTEVIKKILNNLQLEKTTNVKDEIDIQYKINLVQYFCSKGKLPWWAKNESLKILRIYFSEVITKFPEQFKQWFIKAKNQRMCIDLMNENTFDAFVKHTNKTITQSIFAIKGIFDVILQSELSGIRRISKKHSTEIKYQLLLYTINTTVVTELKIIEYLFKKTATLIAIEEKDLKICLQERIHDSALTLSSIKEINIWLDNSIKTNRRTSSSTAQIKQLTKDQKEWRDAIIFSPKKEILTTLKTIYNEALDELIFNLKRSSFRKKIITKLNNPSSIEFINLFLDTSCSSQFLSITTMLKNIGRQITRSQYQEIWNNFIDSILLKIVVDKPTIWTSKDWSSILFESLSPLPDRSATIELLFDASNSTTQITKKIMDEVKEHNKEKEEEMRNEEEHNLPEDVEEETIGEFIYINNSGMIILGPYISMLFERLNLVEKGKFKNKHCQHKAVHILQYAVTGKEEQEERLLMLNKIICGMPVHEPIERNIPVIKEEKELIDGLLKAIIANWSVLGNTTIEGLRETFLCRDGRICIEEEKYVLIVEEKTFDMLLDQIPWSIGKLKLSWMQKLLEVLWRS